MENTNTQTTCEKDVLLLLRKYDVLRPTVHEAMKDAEKLNNTFESRPVSLILECRMVTAVANHPCFLPENHLNAEVQVNSLLPYLSSPCRWVRSLACSLLRVFTLGLDPKGQHFETQGKKNCSLMFLCLLVEVVSSTKIDFTSRHGGGLWGAKVCSRAGGGGGREGTPLFGINPPNRVWFSGSCILNRVCNLSRPRALNKV